MHLDNLRAILARGTAYWRSSAEQVVQADRGARGRVRGGAAVKPLFPGRSFLLQQRHLLRHGCRRGSLLRGVVRCFLGDIRSTLGRVRRGLLRGLEVGRHGAPNVVAARHRAQRFWETVTGLRRRNQTRRTQAGITETTDEFGCEFLAGRVSRKNERNAAVRQTVVCARTGTARRVSRARRDGLGSR